ncbi:MAG: cytidine/deoxycytidylate deaminase family protein [Pseudomonadota bacterium]
MTEKDKRPEWSEYFIDIARLVARRSTCTRRQVGAVLVKDKRILSTGYNGAPTGLAHCVDMGCLREKNNIPSGQRHELCRGLHAEQNAIIQAAYHGISIQGATLYCTTMPCSICLKMLINAGIIKIVYEEGYPDELSENLLKETNIIMTIFISQEGERDEVPVLQQPRG